MLKDNGHQAFFVGGCVRDHVMGIEPHDFDLATSATPDQVESIFPKTIPTGKSFGVMRVLMDDSDIEVATFRSDSKTSDGRRPDKVEWSTLKEDADRRDFTINSLFTEDFETIIDPHGGLDDIKNETIRFIGDPHDRIEEDKLRMVRAVRFAGKLGFSIHPESFAAICQHTDELVTNVSAERLREEMTKILMIPDPTHALIQMRATGLLQKIIPEIMGMWDQCGEQSPKHHAEGNVWEHTLLVIQNTLPLNIETRWSALLHDIGKPGTQKVEGEKISNHGHEFLGAKMTTNILRRLKFPNDQIKKISSIVEHHMDFHRLKEMRDHKLCRLFALGHNEESKFLAIGDGRGSIGKHDTVKEIAEMLDIFHAVQTKWQGKLPTPLINGDDLITLDGKLPRHQFGRVLEKILNVQIDNPNLTKEDLLKRAKGMFVK